MAKNRVLEVPKKGTRPTSERVREALFSRLEHWGYIDGATVADLYAGSGALGLEAASRGAAAVVCVEAYAPAAKLIARNARATGLAAVTTVNKKVESYLDVAPGALPRFDLALVDPPYDLSQAQLARALELLSSHLAADGIVVVERSTRSPEPAWPAGLNLIDQRKMGDTMLWTAQCAESLVS